MTSSAAIVEDFYRAVVARDFSVARHYLHDDLVFIGLFQNLSKH